MKIYVSKKFYNLIFFLEEDMMKNKSGPRDNKTANHIPYTHLFYLINTLG